MYFFAAASPIIISEKYISFTEKFFCIERHYAVHLFVYLLVLLLVVLQIYTFSLVCENPFEPTLLYRAMKFFTQTIVDFCLARTTCVAIFVMGIAFTEILGQAAFQVTSLTNVSLPFTVFVESASGDDRGGLAVINGWIYRTQDNFTTPLVFSTLALSNSTLPRRDGIFSDLATGTLWTLWNGSSDPIFGTNTTPFTLTAIRQMDVDLNILATQVTSSTPPTVESGSCIFAGRGFFPIWRFGTQTFYAIDIAMGNVTTLGTANIAGTYTPSENWLAWGIAEYNSGGYSVLSNGSGSNVNRIMRRNASTGIETIHTQYLPT